jgi:hypothetical protein
MKTESKFDRVKVGNDEGKKEKTFHGKSMRPGGGGAFAKLEESIEKKGKSDSSAKAIAASAGRKKFGNKKMNKFAKAGKKRAAKK